MAYDRSYWKDHVTDQSGEVIQQGTLLDQQHFSGVKCKKPLQSGLFSAIIF